MRTARAVLLLALHQGMQSASAIPASAREAVDNARPWIERLARLGYLAKALLYATIGALATSAALGLGSTATHAHGQHVGSRGAMGALLAAPFGRVLLWVLAAGLLGYGLWRLIEAVADPERHGHDWKGIAVRVRAGVVAMIHFALCYSAVKIALGHLAAARDGQQTEHWTAKALATPGGEIVLYGVAGGLAAYGVYQLYRAWKAKLSDRLSLGRLSFQARRALVWVSRFGIAARGVVFITAGTLFIVAVHEHDPAKADSPTQALWKVFELGTIPFVVVAVGLIAYGVYEVIEARYRRIDIA